MKSKLRILLSFFALVLIFIPITLFASSEPKKKTICLNMIVKNEKEVIVRCLNSVLPIIDSWVIVDTGSTDGTQQIIKDCLKNIPGNLYERPWVDFAHNRQEALEIARTKADYILFMDADDVLSFASDFRMPDLSQDAYTVCTYANGISCWCTRLVKADKDWFWKGAVHETIDCKQPVTQQPLFGISYIYFHDGARSKDPDVILKDIEVLKSEILKSPENPRNYFYLARSYETAGMKEQALETYIKRTQMQGEEQELLMANLKVGILKHQLKHEFKDVEKAYLQAYLSKPYRAEALYYLACLECEKEEYEIAYQILKAALELPSLFSDGLYCENWIYDYGLLMQYAFCARQTGRYLEATKICRELLEENNLPEHTQMSVAGLLNSIYEVNVELMQEKIVELMKL